jgi:dienelactone hydrolase
VIRCLLLLVVLGGCGAQTIARGAGAPVGPWRDQIHWVTMRDENGLPNQLYTRICRPPGETPAPVVLINHGTPPRGSDRPSRQPTACEGEAARWFLQRGYVVVAGMRRGHGASAPVFAESAGGCTAAEFVRSAHVAARDIDALVEYAATLPFARPGQMVMVGQSTGGWSTLGYNAVPHPRVSAMISMAGGRGGHYQMQPSNNCRPDQLVLAAGVLGRSATTPMLWVYAENDSFFDPRLATALRDAFNAAGGQARLTVVPPFGSDGHTLFFGRGGSEIWGPLVERYLAERGGGGSG